MSNSSAPLPKLTPDQRRAAAGQFERARQVFKAGDHDYCLQLLLACCKIDPANLIYRQELRQTQRAKYGNNQKGQTLAVVRSFWSVLNLKKLMLKGSYLEALVQAELILMRNPWDLGTHLAMAQAFEELDWPDHALWTLEQIRPIHSQDPRVNRPLARLYEKRGNFNQAIALWELVRKAVPGDLEAQRKGKDLAASATIAKGKYEEVIRGEALGPQAEKETATDQPVLSTETAGQDRHPRQVTDLMEKIKANPKNANAHLHLSNLYRKADQFDKAREVLRQALAATGNSFDIAQELFDLDIEPFRRDLAVTEERLRQDPDDAELKKIRAQLAKEINTRELEYYRRRSDRYPTDTAARFEMGLRLLRCGQHDEAIKELQAVRSDPRHHGKALFYLGMCFTARKNWKLAQRNLEEALKQFGPGDGALQKEAIFHLAVGYADTGELDRAIELGCDLANLDYNYKNIGTLVDEWQAKATK